MGMKEFSSGAFWDAENIAGSVSANHFSRYRLIKGRYRYLKFDIIDTQVFLVKYQHL